MDENENERDVSGLENTLMSRFAYALETDQHFRENMYFLALGENHSAAKRETFLHVATQTVGWPEMRRYVKGMPSLGTLPINKPTRVWYLHHSIVTLPLFDEFKQMLKSKKPHSLLQKYNFSRRIDPWEVASRIPKETAAHIQLSLLADVYETNSDFKEKWDKKNENNSVYKIDYFCF